MEFQVKRNELSKGRLANSALDDNAALSAGELLLKIDKFGFSANNITYGAIGEQLGYWQFFPASDNDSNEWGVIPVWGFAEVVASEVDGVAQGERLFGYFPPANYLRMQNVRASETRLVDGAEHRSSLPAGYNIYSRVTMESGYDGSQDNSRMLLWPLHITSFCIWDRLQEQHWRGAKQILVVSASSKTSLGLGYALADDDSAPTSVGLTSNANQAWVTELGIYDQTSSYDALDEVDASIPTLIVDMSGNGSLLANLQAHLGENLVYCVNVGLTHWDEASSDNGIDDNKKEFFFAPSHIQKRIKEWGPEGFDQKSAEFMQSTSARSAKWMEIRQLRGVEDLLEIYSEVCAGNLPPAQGLVIKL